MFSALPIICDVLDWLNTWYSSFDWYHSSSFLRNTLSSFCFSDSWWKTLEYSLFCCSSLLLAYIFKIFFFVNIGDLSVDESFCLYAIGIVRELFVRVIRVYWRFIVITEGVVNGSFVEIIDKLRELGILRFYYCAVNLSGLEDVVLRSNVVVRHLYCIRLQVLDIDHWDNLINVLPYKLLGLPEQYRLLLLPLVLWLLIAFILGIWIGNVPLPQR